MSEVKGFIAVPSSDAKAGASVWWRLSGEFARGSLSSHLETAGLDPEIWLPKEPSLEKSFGRAVRSLFKDKYHNVETLKGGGYAVIKKTKSETDVEHETTYALRLVKGKVEAVGTGSYVPMSVLADVEFSMAHYSATVIADDVSSWLIKCAEKLDAVSLRDRGGIYFVPSHTLATWKLLTGALVKASGETHTVYSMTTLKEKDAVAAILDALTLEAEDFFTSCSEKIELGKIGGKRAIKNRMTDADTLLGKIRSYESLLGEKLETLTEHLGDVELELSAALLHAEEPAVVPGAPLALAI